ncbi:unnamed protein product [Rangifer tarandus platyrhynchus]|uniref:Uncharacterized protein n=1 Tax=Rangifer tarandus platyrhynchus TaxID=3082113 RepID=A0ABN8ZV30_RANTA|nr:unnamed protein product [Rangifer tarandus platyrhynchus]
MNPHQGLNWVLLWGPSSAISEVLATPTPPPPSAAPLGRATRPTLGRGAEPGPAHGRWRLPPPACARHCALWLPQPGRGGERAYPPRRPLRPRSRRRRSFFESLPGRGRSQLGASRGWASTEPRSAPPPPPAASCSPPPARAHAAAPVLAPIGAPPPAPPPAGPPRPAPSPAVAASLPGQRYSLLRVLSRSAQLFLRNEEPLHGEMEVKRALKGRIQSLRITI